jgi:hypothetical protein
MTSTLFLPAFLIFVFCGLYTWMVGRAAFGGSPGIEGLFRLPWLGYGLMLGLLQITHLFSPLDRRFSIGFLFLSSVLVMLIAFVRAGWHGRNLSNVIKDWPRLVPLLLIAFVTFIPVFNTCTKPACHYDLGLYYLQEIRWMETFPIVRGLGNLLLNLGFNQSAFLVTSFVDGLLPDRIGLWLVGGLLPWLGLTLSTYALLRLVVARRVQRTPLEIAYAISVPAWIYTLLGNNISSGSPDVASACLLIHLFLAFAAFTMTVDRLERARLFGDLWLLGAICICVKLNTLGMVAGIWSAATLFLILEKDVSRAWRSEAVYGVAIAACLLGFWVYRGVLLTGYPLFPSRVISAPVAWQVKASEADQVREDTVYWARIPYGDRKVALDGLSWVTPWMKRVMSLDIQFDWPIGIGLIGSAALLLLAWMERRLRRSSYFLMLLCLPLLFHAVFWISTAPEPRYFGSTPWLFATAPILGLIAAEQSLAFLSAVANLYLCAVPMAGLVVGTSWQWAAPDDRFPEIPRANMVEHTNRLGLNYYAPVEGNQSFDNALPCSNRKLYDIGLLSPAAGIAGGFRPVDDKENVSSVTGWTQREP